MRMYVQDSLRVCVSQRVKLWSVTFLIVISWQGIMLAVEVNVALNSLIITKSPLLSLMSYVTSSHIILPLINITNTNFIIKCVGIFFTNNFPAFHAHGEHFISYTNLPHQSTQYLHLFPHILLCHILYYSVISCINQLYLD